MDERFVIKPEDEPYFQKYILSEAKNPSNKGEIKNCIALLHFKDTKVKKKKWEEFAGTQEYYKCRDEVVAAIRKRIEEYTDPAKRITKEAHKYITNFKQYHDFIVNDLDNGITDVRASKYEKAIQKQKAQAAREEKEREKARETAIKNSVNISAMFDMIEDTVMPEYLNELIQQLETAFKSQQLYVIRTDYSQRYFDHYRQEEEPLSSYNYKEFLNMFSSNDNDALFNNFPWSDEGQSLAFDLLNLEGWNDDLDSAVEEKECEELLDAIVREAKAHFPEVSIDELEEIFRDDANEEVGWNSEKHYEIVEALMDAFPVKRIIDCIKVNPYYSAYFKAIDDIQSSMVRAIPQHYPDLYPDARKMHRHFILNLGDTNSGKTYESVKELEKSDDGVYLAPLRLLAYEQYEKMTTDGIRCSMLTGEEKIILPDAAVTSSTIEMADLSKRYKVAVIDEVQMLADEDRGGAWMKAILGIKADAIYLCGSQDAEEVLVKIIQDCGDDYEIHHFERKTELQFESALFHFPEDVQRGDALISFSRKSVNYIAAELTKAGHNCSVIYGSLPYDIRHKQAELFADGSNDIVVATDAIGMGMNLPIKRIIFMESTKYDGHSRRPLDVSEVHQIAGRAGRIGMYDIGLVNSIGDRKKMRDKFYDDLPAISEVRIGFPKSLLGIDAPLSMIVEQWNNYEFQENWILKSSTAELLKLTKIVENETKLNKVTIYQLASMQFDSDNSALFAVWKDFLEAQEKKKHINLPSMYQYYKDYDGHDELQREEYNYKLCDLLYQYSNRFEDGEYDQELTDEKVNISKRINELLRQHPYKPKRCSRCGKILPWNYEYGMCKECHDNLYPPRNFRSDYDFEEEDMEDEDWY